jgi:hypothetical protein
MHMRSLTTIFASFLGLAGACTSDDYVAIPYYDAYLYPVVDYGYVDYTYWYDGYYDPYIGYAALTALPPGAQPDAEPDGGTHNVFPRPLNGLLAAWRAVVRPECVPHVAYVDYDEDGIPSSYEATFACVDQTVGDRTSTVTGTISIMDSDDNVKPSGFTVVLTNFSVTTSAGGNTRTRTLNGAATLTSSGDGRFQSDTALTVDFDFSDAGRTRVQGSYSSMGQATYTPDSSAGDDTFAAGIVTLSGTGMLTRMFEGNTQSRMLTRQTNPPLHWNRSCRMHNPESSGFDYGTLVYEDDHGSRVQLQFNGCGNPTVTTTG